jgi:hypothetical protein
VTLPDGAKVTAKVWNGTVANLTLMALGSSAPEILLAIIEVGAARTAFLLWWPHHVASGPGGRELLLLWRPWPKHDRWVRRLQPAYDHIRVHLGTSAGSVSYAGVILRYSD